MQELAYLAAVGLVEPCNAEISACRPGTRQKGARLMGGEVGKSPSDYMLELHFHSGCGVS